MRNVVLNLAVTLDGFIEGPNGELDWLVRDETIDFGDILNDILSDKDAIFYGRVSYEKWGKLHPAGREREDRGRICVNAREAKIRLLTQPDWR
jgi:dihydrofolate reductase